MAHIVVLGRQCVSALAAVRSLGKAGHEVDLIYNGFKKDGYIVSKCKYIHRYREIAVWNDGEGTIKAILSLAKKDEKLVLFSTDDRDTELIAGNTAILEKDFIFPVFANGDNGKQMASYMHKDVQLQLAEKCGLPTAKSWVIRLQDEVPMISDEIQYPCFSKPLCSTDGNKYEMSISSSREQLEEKIEALKKKGRKELLVQELLSIDGEYVMEGVCRDQEIVLPAVIQKTCVARKSKGITLSGYLVEFEFLPEDVRQGILRFLKELHYVGMFDLELIVANGTLYFGEINFRSGGPTYVYTLCGANLPDLAVRAMLDCPISGDHKAVLGKTFVNDRVLWEDFAAGYISFGDFWKKYYHSDFSLIRDADDPVSSQLYDKHMRKVTVKAKIKQTLKKLLRR